MLLYFSFLFVSACFYDRMAGLNKDVEISRETWQVMFFGVYI